MNVEKILQQMTLEEKIALCSGENFWQTKTFAQYGIPALFMCDGPHGLRKQENEADMLGVHESREATCFPAEVTAAGNWDPELLEQIGAAIGEEAKDQGVGLVLGPGANLKRNPLCGRNFEYFSEDPYLAGKLAAGFIRGVEARGIGTSLKHFAVNSQEYRRFTSDSVLDERTLRELYLTAFEIAVKEGKPSTVMCAYPKLNGVHCSDNKDLLSGILRSEWGFDGMVVTDWGAMNDRLEGFRSGCDLNMPGGSAYMEKEALRAVKSGTLPASAVDDSARRVLKLALWAAETRKAPTACDYGAHHALALRAAEEGAVLLKNADGILPLRENAKIAVIGAMAKTMRYQGSGSSHINPTKLSQPLDFLHGAVYAPGCDDQGGATDALLAEARTVAENAEVAVVFAGLPGHYESEGFDRDSMEMPEGHLRMIEAVASANPRTVVVLLSGSAVECPWADGVKAILYMGLPGQAGGEAIAVQANVLDKESLKKAHDVVLEEFGPCEVLINGAGGNNPKGTTTSEYFSKEDMLDENARSFFDLDQDGVSFVFNLNFLGTLLTTQAFATDMLETGGCIVNISSMNAFTPLTKIPAYSGAKAAVSNFTQWLAVHFANCNIRVNAIAPGFFATNQNRTLLFNEDGSLTPRSHKIISQTPMGRFGKPEELLGTLRFLIDNDASGFVTGITIPVDGGFSAYSGV